MAVEIIGGAFFSTLFEKLFDKLGSSEHVNFFREAKVNARLLRKLQITLMSAEQLHGDAEEKQFGNPALRKWLFELKDAIMAAEELLDQINYEAMLYEDETRSGSGIGKRLKLSVSGCSRNFDEEIEEIRDSLEHIMKQKGFYGIKEGVKERSLLRLPAPLVEESRVYGRSDLKEKIVGRLLSDNSDGDKISVIPIVGMGGIGKTTVAQIVYEDDRVRNHFKDFRAWATVSDDFDILKLTRTIFKDITSRECGSDSLDQLQRKLKEALTEKKFLLVLDDVWNEKYEQWDVFKSPFLSGAYGSKIIVTTRSDKVVKVMGNVQAHCLEELSDDDCWSLFAEHVFGNANPVSCQDLHDIGREIVKKCKGLPLAVKALAGLLRSVNDREEWQKILTNNIWELQLHENTSNGILPSLWLSYHYLPSHLKRCFTYCSIFPKDYEIGGSERELIIKLWMAEGLLQPGQKGKRTSDVGDEYFQDLISRSLFQRGSKYRSNIVMHDRVHDLAVFLSGEFCFRLDEYDQTKFSAKTRHFSYFSGHAFENFKRLSTAKNLHTCVQLEDYSRYSLYLQSHKPWIPEGGCLRALGPSGIYLTGPLLAICNLKLLRYLDLSCMGITEIPNTLCRLYYLQTLLLSYCKKLTELPANMGKLVNLCHLGIEEVYLSKMPQKMCNLKDLETLCQFVLGKNDCSSIKELGGLHHLSGRLAIKNLQNVDDVADVSEANLKDKKYLNKIVYHWSSNGGVGHSGKDRNILDALEPHTNVKGLCMEGYGGELFSDWVGHTSYANLIILEITKCNSRLLPPLGQLPALENLSISECHSVVAIGAEFYRERTLEIRPFRSLKYLKFMAMSAWQEWLFLEGQDGGCFPSLVKLHIYDCPILNICFSDYFPSLKALEIQGNNGINRFLPDTREMDTVFPSLEHLDMHTCLGLETFLLANSHPSMKKLRLSDYNQWAPLLSARAPSLLLVYDRGCENVMPEARLSTTLTSIVSLQNLKALNFGCFQHLTSLENLEIEDCRELRDFPGEMLPTSLTSLRISHVPNLTDLGKGLQHLSLLKNLEIEDCPELRDFPGEMLPTSLTSLRISRVPNLTDLGKGLQHLSLLKKLEIWNCKKLQQFPEEGLPMQLTSISIRWLLDWKYLCKRVQELVCVEDLDISFCENLQQLAGEDPQTGFQHLSSLKKLTIWWCEKLQWLLHEGLPTTLTHLCIRHFPNLEDLTRTKIQLLVCLERLEIGWCQNLRSLPEEGLPPSLLSLRIYGCPLLEPRCIRETGQDWPKIAFIPYLQIVL